MKMINLLLLSCFLLFFFAQTEISNTTKKYKLENLDENFFPNPNSGCYHWFKHTRSDSFSFKSLNTKIYYSASVYDRPCWKDMIRLGKVQMTSLDALFDTAYCRKFRVDIGIFYNLSMQPEKKFRLRNEQYCGKDIYIAYPEELHEQLMLSKKYKPRLVYVPDADVYWYCIDWRNPLAKIEYKKLLSAFNDYLNESWRGTSRRKYINSIQIRFWGFWGEGHNNYLIVQNNGHDDVFEDSKTMIEMDNYYIKLFHDIRLIAPAMGKTANIPDKWKEWAMYELTAHNDVGELGLFIDHLGITSKGDFTLMYNGIDTKKIALNKWETAPVTGEGFIINNYSSTQKKWIRIDSYIPLYLYDVSRYHVCSFLPMKKIYLNNEIFVLDSLIKSTGYKLYYQNKKEYIKERKLYINIQIGNKGSSPVYNNFWKLQFVIRDSSGKLLEIISPDVDIRKIMPNKFTEIPNSNNKLNIDQTFNVDHQGKIYLRIIDTDGIAPNMYLYNEDRTINGEYQLN